MGPKRAQVLQEVRSALKHSGYELKGHLRGDNPDAEEFDGQMEVVVTTRDVYLSFRWFGKNLTRKGGSYRKCGGELIMENTKRLDAYEFDFEPLPDSENSICLEMERKLGAEGWNGAEFRFQFRG
jgi:hypothetical protein